MNEECATDNYLRILIADNSAALRERLQDVLAKVAGVKVVAQTQNARETLHHARALCPDVLILDIKMPGSGLSVLEELKRTQPEILVLMLTNHSEAPYRKRCAELGTDHFFAKSTDLGALVNLIEALAQQHERN